MKKIKEIFSNTSITLKDLFKRIPITLIIIIITTLFLAITINSKIDREIVNKAFVFGIIFSLQTFFIEIYIKKNYLKIGLSILSAIISYCFIHFIYNTEYNLEAIRIVIGYLSILTLLNIYKILKESKLKFNEFLLKIFANVFNSTIIYLVLNVGITLLTVVFIELILDGNHREIIIRTQILILGLFYVPAVLNSISEEKNIEVNLFIKGLIKYVLLPLAAIGILIIYIYILKILLLQRIPSNIIFRILAGIFIFAFPVWNMAENFKDENKIIDKTTKVLPYLYMPFILLEIYSLVLRISEYGITPIRYFGIIFIVLQIIALILTVIKKKESLPHIFIYASILAVVSFILPITNYDIVSKTNQKKLLEKYYKEETSFELLLEEEKQKVSGAYKYLYENKGLKYVPEYITQEERDIFNKYIEESNSRYILEGLIYEDEEAIAKEKELIAKEKGLMFFTDEAEQINVEGYSKIIEVNQEISNDIGNIPLKNNRGVFICNVNLKNLVNNVIEINKNNEKGQQAQQYFNENKIVKIDDSKDLYIRNIDLSYDSQMNKIVFLSINGYILER